MGTMLEGVTKMNLFDLYAKITLDKSGVDSGITETQEKLLQAKKNIENVGTAAKNAAKTFATIGAGIGAAGTAAYAFANKVAQNGDNIDKMSQKLGMSATAYQEWDHIMEHCGMSIDSLQAGMKTLASAAETGNDAFDKLGLTQEKIAGMNQEELFNATIEALQNVSSETERTYLAGQLLGRGATELGPLLNTSSEDIEAMRQNLHDMGAVMSDEAVKSGAAFQDALTNLKSAFSGASNSLGEKLIPGITSLMDHLTGFIADGGLDKITTGFKNLAPVIAGATSAMVAYKSASAISGVIEALTKATQGQTIAQAALNAIMNANPFVLVATLIAAVGTALVTLYATNEDFRNKVTGSWGKIKETISTAVESIKTFFTKTIPDSAKTALDWFKSIPDQMREVGRNLLTGLWNGIRDKIEWLKGKVTGVVNTIKGWFTGKDGFDEHSPSKWSKQVFRYVMDGGADGLDAGLPGLMRSAESVTDRVKSGLDFGVASVDYAFSGLGKQQTDIRSAIRAVGDNGATGPITINLVTPTGRNLATWIMGELRDYSRSYGVSPI